MARAKWDGLLDSHALVFGLLKSRAVALNHRVFSDDTMGEVVVDDEDDAGNACLTALSSRALSCWLFRF